MPEASDPHPEEKANDNARRRRHARTRRGALDPRRRYAFTRRTSAARRKDLSGLPPAYTFVTTAEPFCAETVAYIEGLRAAGVEAEIDIYEGLYHVFDMLTPWRKASKLAARRFEEHFLYAKEHYFAKND